MHEENMLADQFLRGHIVEFLEVGEHHKNSWLKIRREWEFLSEKTLAFSFIFFVKVYKSFYYNQYQILK